MFRYFFIFLFITSSAFGQLIQGGPSPVFDLSKDQVQQFQEWKYFFGDTLNAADPKFDDSTWNLVKTGDFRIKKKGLHWLRIQVKLDSIQPFPRLMIFRSWNLPTAFEVYWDGKLFSENGKVGHDKTSEFPGRNSHLFGIVPALLTKGNHVLAIRFSNYHSFLSQSIGLHFFGYEGYLLGPPVNRHLGFILYIGVFLASTFVGLALYFGGNRYFAYLIFTIICFLNMFRYVTLFSLEILNLPMNFVQIQRIVARTTHSLSELLIIIFYIILFKVSKRNIHCWVSGIIIITLNIVDLFGTFPFNYSLWILSFYTIFILLYSVRQRRTGSLIALIGYILASLIALTSQLVLINNIFAVIVSYFIFIFSIILAIGRQLGEQDRQHKEAIHHSQRLETELLKKHIQPHFIMNTLFSIVALIRTEPKKAILMIQALAEEFRIVNQISPKQLITMEEEMELCRKHLEIMQFRKNAHFQLLVNEVKLQDKIPPMIFHTLIENGLTHAYKTKENGTFQLTGNYSDHQIQYCLRNDGSKLKHVSEKSELQIEEGMGLKYVKARLQESFKDDWNIKYGITNGYWQVEITLFRNEK